MATVIPADIDTEVTYVSGVGDNGKVAGTSFATWNGDDPATYSTTSTAFKWGTSHTAGTTGGTVSYYIDPATLGSTITQSMINATLTLWSDEANIKFVQTTTKTAANFVIQGTAPGVYADAQTNVKVTTAGSATLGTVVGQSVLNLTAGATFNGNMAQEAQSISILEHEEGHILGFGHAGAYDGDSPVVALTGDDSTQYTQMSYVTGAEVSSWGQTLVSSTTNSNGSVTSSYEVAAPSTPMIVDILAEQRLYGAPTTTALSGGQVFGFNCNVTDASKIFFDFTQNTQPVVTLFDTGTGNTLDLSGFNSNSSINLAQGAFTSANGETNNIGISYGTVITTAIGGGGNDFFYVGGSDGVQHFDGGGGVNFVGTSTAAGSGTVVVDLKDGLVSKGGTTDATITNVLGVQLSSGTSSVMGLASGTDLIYGGSGALTFTGEGGIDYIQGSTGTNTILGGTGAEIFFSNGGSDTVTGGSGGNFLQAGQTAASSDLYKGTTGNSFVYGGAGTTHLIAGSGTEFLSGGAGTNIMDGGTGLDIFNGGSGSDTFNGGSGTNLLFEATGSDSFVGGHGTDYIYGGSGTSNVQGGSGTDVLTAGAGNQHLTAGSGATVFNLGAASQHAGRMDLIDNFSGGTGTNIYLAHADMGTTTFVAQSGGVAIMTSVAGGTSEIFASNVSVAAVQAHTHFTM